MPLSVTVTTTLPSSLAGLGKVNGIGETKLARYGQQVLDLLAELNGQPQ